MTLGDGGGNVVGEYGLRGILHAIEAAEPEVLMDVSGPPLEPLPLAPHVERASEQRVDLDS